MNIKYVDSEARFYFICENCGHPIKNNKGVVDFPMSCSKNNKAPLRFYHKGDCAYQGNNRRTKDFWGNWQIDEFIKNLDTGKWPEMLELMLGTKNPDERTKK